MKEKISSIIAWAVLMVIALAVIAPALLVFTVGRNGEPTVWNVVGLVYIAGWVLYLNKKK